MPAQMQTVTSKDGTRIAFWRSGAGAPLVLVHGTSADHIRWAPVLPGLEASFTVYAVDRRGRGGSGDNANYALERETEDVAAVVDSIGGPVNVLGHSYGAICSLGAALRTTHLSRLVLYEPPLSVDGSNMNPQEPLKKMREQLAADDRDGMVATFMTAFVRMPPRELEMMRAAPAWQGRIAAAHTILREVDDESARYSFDPGKLRNMKTPTLLLQGGDSPAFLKAAVNMLNGQLPDSRIVVMPGQQHAAMNTAPDLFLQDVLGFLAVPVGALSA